MSDNREMPRPGVSVVELGVDDVFKPGIAVYNHRGLRKLEITTNDMMKYAVKDAEGTLAFRRMREQSGVEDHLRTTHARRTMSVY